MKEVKLLDCTLRDGGYVNHWKFGKETICNILDRLSQSEVDLVECGFLTEMYKDPDHTLFANADQINDYLKNPNPNTMYVAMIAIGEKEIHPEKLCDAKDTILDGIRLTFHPEETKKAFEWAGILKKKGYQVFIQPVGSACYDDVTILDLIKKVNNLLPYAFYIVDTLGAMSIKDMMHMLHLVDKNLDPAIALGYHSHNNLQLAFANAQRMVEFDFKRTILIDCSVYGMGRGAGNLCTELMMDYLKKNQDAHYDVVPILEIVDNDLMTIYLQHPWGYSVAYFLASAFACHPNYVSYFLGKQNMQVRTIRSLLQQIPTEYRLVYHPEIIDEIYRNYQINAIDDSKEISWIRKLLKGKKILLLAPGKSIKSKRKAINAYIDEHHPFVIATNFIPNVPVDAYFVANQKRYERIRDVLPVERTIFTSNIKDLPEGAHVVNYSELLNAGKDVFDSSGMMLIKLLIRGKVKQISIAGMDGFRKNPQENYFENQFLYQIEKEDIKQKNLQMQEQIKLFRKEIGIHFITPSKYDA